MRIPHLVAALVLSACSIGDEGPAPQGTPSATAAARAGEIADQAEEIRRLAHELTSLTDEARRQVASGASTPDAEIAKMRALAAQIEEKEAALRANLVALEEGLHTDAGDPVWPQEEVTGR